MIEELIHKGTAEKKLIMLSSFQNREKSCEMAEPNHNHLKRPVGPGTPRPAQVIERKLSHNNENLTFFIHHEGYENHEMPKDKVAEPEKKRVKLSEEASPTPEPATVFFEWYDSQGRKFYDEYGLKRSSIPSEEVEKVQPNSLVPSQIRSPSPIKHNTALDSLVYIVKDARVPMDAKIGVVRTISSLATEGKSMMNRDFLESLHLVCWEILNRQDYAEISAALSLLELLIKTNPRSMNVFRDFLEPLAKQNDVVNRATYLLRYIT